MLLKPFYRLFAAEPDTAGSGPAAIDRGDLLDDDINPDDPDGDLAPEVDVKDDPAVKDLEAELDAPKDDDKKKDSRIPRSASSPSTSRVASWLT